MVIQKEPKPSVFSVEDHFHRVHFQLGVLDGDLGSNGEV